MSAPVYCSFCGKPNHEVLVLIAGPSVGICAECVDLCAQIVAEKRAALPCPWLPEDLASWLAGAVA